MCADIRFEKLTCVAKGTISETPISILRCLLRSKSQNSTKPILNSVSGAFRSGTLTGILGPSGAGKTTLLNILAGYLTSGVSGDVFVNETKKCASDLKRSSTYLTQDTLVQPFLTARESLKIAAELKLDASDDFKDITVRHVATTLGLNECLDTRSEYLSGGERKRLSIALELISNPYIMLLDEPTTGLDEVSMKMCMELLKRLSLEGKTVICTIHQPSNTILQLFDHLYILDDGFCIYKGPPNRLVPFLALANFHCLKTYNPADYILEISQANGENRQILTENVNKIGNDNSKITQNSSNNQNSIKPIRMYDARPTFNRQVTVLLYRNFLQLYRNIPNILIQCLHFTLCGLIVGATYFGMGQDAKHFFHNFCLCLIIVVYLVFSNAIPPALTYPLEFKLFKTEIFNGWYDVNAYFTSLTLTSLPIPIIMSVVFTAITYLMSNQPSEMDRFVKVCLILIITVIISETHGKTVAMCYNVTHSSIVAPASLLPSISLAFYGFGHAGQLSIFIKTIMQMSFVRYSMVGVFGALYNNRDRMECSDIYCHYNEPSLFLIDMGMTGSYEVQIGALLTFLVLYKCVMYVFLRIRLK